jgi:hypothetical protein
MEDLQSQLTPIRRALPQQTLAHGQGFGQAGGGFEFVLVVWIDVQNNGS